MFWIKSLFAALIVGGALLLGIEFSALNANPAKLNYILGTVEWPLSFVVVCAFALGSLITAFISLVVTTPLRWRAGRLQRTVSGQEQEINTLLKKSNRSTRQA